MQFSFQNHLELVLADHALGSELMSLFSKSSYSFELPLDAVRNFNQKTEITFFPTMDSFPTMVSKSRWEFHLKVYYVLIQGI